MGDKRDAHDETEVRRDAADGVADGHIHHADAAAGESASAARASSAAKMETSSSGKVVAKLTTVAPTISFGMPEASAIHDAASTKKSPPLMMSTRPTMSSKTVIAISICKFPFFTLSDVFVFFFRKITPRKTLFLL